MFIVLHRKFFYAFSGILIFAGIASLCLWGLKPSIDFTGGTSLEVSYVSTSTAPTVAQISKQVSSAIQVTDLSVRPAGTNDFIINTRVISAAEETTVMKALADNGAYTPQEKEFDSIGPVLGAEALQKSWIALVLVLLAIVLFITFAFRKVSRPVSSWWYGLIAIIALCHDVLIPTGIFSILGHFAGIEVDTLFVTALLVILGFSVHDTIVVFDRVRENLRRNEDLKLKKDFDTIVGESINQTFVRSINTSLTTLLAILVLYIVGPVSTQHFALALLIGITTGTYSSIFIGSPLLVTVYKYKLKKAAR
ncbi:MAG TPA: protein translocase subunit SecF [Candidatus Paceibacterota bacterium]|nr:protein translocase subunit SecF [Candidatus Paceibacterota bacterium]